MLVESLTLGLPVAHITRESYGGLARLSTKQGDFKFDQFVGSFTATIYVHVGRGTSYVDGQRNSSTIFSTKAGVVHLPGSFGITGQYVKRIGHRHEY